MSVSVRVECYAGYKADQRPVRFALGQPPEGGSERVYTVTKLLDQWYGVDYECFKVRADDHNLYILRHHLEQDTWTLDSFRSLPL